MDSWQMSLQLTPLLFSHTHTHKDTQLELTVNLIISDQALSHVQKATYQWAVDKFIHHAVNSVMCDSGTALQLYDNNNIGMAD